MVFSEKQQLGVQGAAVGPLAGSKGRGPCGGPLKLFSNFNPPKMTYPLTKMWFLYGTSFILMPKTGGGWGRSSSSTLACGKGLGVVLCEDFKKQHFIIYFIFI